MFSISSTYCAVPVETTFDIVMELTEINALHLKFFVVNYSQMINLYYSVVESSNKPHYS